MYGAHRLAGRLAALRVPLVTIGILLAALAMSAARADEASDAWHATVARVRVLAENDSLRAYQEAERLQAQLPKDAPAADRAAVLNLIARCEIYLAQTDAAASHTQLALDLATKSNDRIGQAEADLNIALNSVNQGRIDKLVEATTHGLTALQGVDRPDLLAEAMLRTAMMYRRVGQFDASVTTAMQTMEIARRSGDPMALAYAHQGLGISFSQSDRWDEAQEHFTKMREQSRAAHSRQLEAYSLTGLSVIAAHRGDFKSSESMSREAVAIFREVGMPFNLGHAMFGLADQFRLQHRYAEAAALLDDVLAIYTRYPNSIGLWFTLNARSAINESRGQFDAARADAVRAYELAKTIGLTNYRIESAQRRSALAAARGNFKEAYEFAREASDLTAKAAQEKASSRMLELTQRYETESKQRQIVDLTRRNELQTAELRQRELRQRWLFTVLAAVVLALAGTAFFTIRLRRSKEAIRALNEGLEQRVQASTAELRQQTSYLRSLIDTLPLMAWLKDTSGRYLAVNQAMAKASGRTTTEMIGNPISDSWPPQVAARSRSEDVAVMTTHQRMITETPLTTPSGDVMWLEVFRAPVVDDDGNLLGTVGVAQDISERKAAEAAREEALAEAKRLARQRSDFLAQMSHELRTPLNGILGFAELLQQDPGVNERQLRGLKIIRESGQHLLALINDLLDLARIDAAKLELNPTELNLAAFLAVVTDIVRVKAEEKHLLFALRIDEGLPAAVRADEKRLRQVLLNLLSNAIKFTDAGEVSLQVAAGGEGPAGKRLRFVVRDSGVGMSPEQAARLFQPFEQVGEAKRREGGAGLGLAISRELIRLMGGDIRVTSEADQGSEFSFEIELPVVQAAPVAAARGQGRPLGYEGPRRRVLVVDDVPQNRAVLVDSLEVLGFDISEAANGEEALRQVRDARPDLVLMDITMPVLDGLEATRRLRASPGPHHPTIVACSGSTDPLMQTRCHDAGADAFLAKPVSQEALLSITGRLLGLTWIREGSEPPAPPPPPLREVDIVCPPADETEALERLGLLGNMRSIRDRADHLERLDARYAPLARQLRHLAEACQSRAIVELVDRLKARLSASAASLNDRPAPT